MLNVRGTCQLAKQKLQTFFETELVSYAPEIEIDILIYITEIKIWVVMNGGKIG